MNPRLMPTSRLARVTILRSQSDERLSDLAGHGSDAAFEAIVNRYRSSLVGHCTRILGSNADAEEATQDALVSAHAALMNGHEVRSLGPWMHAVAHNAALRILRRRVARAEYPQPDCNGHSCTEAPDVTGLELRDVVQAVQALPHRQRDAIVMRELEGRSYAEIAARLGATDGAVRQLLNRARTSMRNTLGALVPAEPLVRWLMSADDSSPARGLLTLSGGSAIAIKLSGAAALSAVTAVALLPSTHGPARPRPTRAGSIASQRVVTGSRRDRPALLASARAGTTTVSRASDGSGRALSPTSAPVANASSTKQGELQYSVASAKPAATGNAGSGRPGGGSQKTAGKPQGGKPSEPSAGGRHQAPASGHGAPSTAGMPGGSTSMVESPRLPSPQPQMVRPSSQNSSDGWGGGAPSVS